MTSHSSATVSHDSTRRRRHPRFDSIDILRSAAIVLMVVVHFVENLSGRHGAGDIFAAGYRAVWLPTGFAAPIFTFLTGLNYRLWVDARAARGDGNDRISRLTIRRGLFLFGLGFAFNVFVWLPADTFNWDILTFIGAALIVLDVVRRLPGAVSLVGCGLVLGIAPVLRVIADYPAYWTGGWFDYDWTLSDVMLGFLVVGYFPVFPWIVAPVVGFVTARSILAPNDCPEKRHQGRTTATTGVPPIAFGAACLAASVAALAARPLLPGRLTSGTTTGWTMFPASTAYLLGTLGLAIVASTLLHRAVDDRSAPWLARLVRWTGPLSRHALSVYLLHHVVHVWPMWIAGLIAEGDATALWQVALPPWTAFLAAIGFLVAAVLFFEWADRHRVPTVESLMRWLSD